MLVAENLVVAVWSDDEQWLPCQLLFGLTKEEATSVAYGRALVLVGLYVDVAVGAAAVLFRRRDGVA